MPPLKMERASAMLQITWPSRGLTHCQSGEPGGSTWSPPVPLACRIVKEPMSVWDLARKYQRGF